MNALNEAGVLANDAMTLAYSYIGPEVTEAVYRKGTIGRAKDHLEATAFEITKQLESVNCKAYVSVNKALVTQASSAIPVIPLYISLLYKTMKEQGIHEGCIEQIERLFNERLYAENPQGTVVIQADRKATTDVLIKVMDASRAAGIQDVSIAAQEP